MLNDRIIKNYSISLYIEEMNKIHKTKAVFNQADRKTSVIVVQLLNNKNDKAIIDLTGSKVIAKIMKNDNTTSDILCSILEAELGVVAIGLTQQALLAIGENIIELEIQSNDQILYSPKMSYTVVDNLYDENELIKSQDEFPVLNALILNVQALESELVKINGLLNASEELRKSSEEERKTNETLRNKEFGNLEASIQTLINSVNLKINEIDSAILKSQQDIQTEISKINSVLDNKILEFNGKIAEVNYLIQDVNNFLISSESSITSCINSFNDKILQVNEFMNNTIKTLDDKEKLLIEKINEFNSKIEEINRINTQNTNVISSKIEECNNILTSMNELSGNVISAEEVRNANEVSRINTFNNITAELEITQTDLDDILSMIGGL